jgi:dTDP-4-dehydrorhamnose reductase
MNPNVFNIQMFVGANDYVTSDRYLDHRTYLYPEDRRSADGDFVDLEAVRMVPLELCGFKTITLDAWRRYRIPVTITEIQLSGPVEDQIRWAAEA